MSLRSVAAVLLLGLLASVSAQAKDAKIGDVPVVLTAPPGHCELETSQPSDAKLLQSLGVAIGPNTLLGMYADCKQLGDWRSGKRGLLEDFAQYQVSAEAAGMAPPPDPVQVLKQICARMREDGEKAMAGMAADVKQRVEQAIKNTQMNQVRFLGVMADEPGVCYSAFVQRLKAQTGKDVTIVGLSATMFVKGKLLYYYLYAPYRSAQTVTALLARQKLNAAALLAANK